MMILNEFFWPVRNSNPAEYPIRDGEFVDWKMTQLFLGGHCADEAKSSDNIRVDFLLLASFAGEMTYSFQMQL